MFDVGKSILSTCLGYLIINELFTLKIMFLAVKICINLISNLHRWYWQDYNSNITQNMPRDRRELYRSRIAGYD